MSIAIKRVHDPPSDADGYRVLVDRLWPRGISKERAAIDLWLKELAPSRELRRWFGHDPARWEAFRERYFRELGAHTEHLKPLMALSRRRRITLVYGAKEERFNNAVALKAYLSEHSGTRGPRNPNESARRKSGHSIGQPTTLEQCCRDSGKGGSNDTGPA